MLVTLQGHVAVVNQTLIMETVVEVMIVVVVEGGAWVIIANVALTADAAQHHPESMGGERNGLSMILRFLRAALKVWLLTSG
jgi:carbamoylphosphate synthase small subunit